MVAVGSGNTDTIATSQNGIDWTGRGNTIFDSLGNGVAWNGSLWVAVGSGSTDSIATSPDGVSWTGRGNTILYEGNGVAWNGSLWVAVGISLINTIATSSDGITWTGRGNTIFNYIGHGIAWNGSLWVAVGYGTNTIATSTDGITWTGRRNDIGLLQLGNDINGEAGGDQSGYSVALSSDGTIVAIGAPYNSNTFTYRGQVRIYKWNGISWSQVGIDIDGAAIYERNGWSVALSSDGTSVAMGAPFSGGGSDSGQVRVFKWNGIIWSKVGNSINGASDNDYSGSAVALSSDGTIVAIGSIGAPFGLNTGQVRVFKLNSNIWSQRGSNINGEEDEEQCGYSVALSSDGTIVAMGSPYNDAGVVDSNTGKVRVFKWDETSWTQRGTDINGSTAGEQCGISVALSSDGTIVAIGSPYNSVSGSNSGQVRVFKWDSSSWIQVGNDIYGEMDGGLSGYSVSLSGDGTIIAIGVPGIGQVKVYKLNGISWLQFYNNINGSEAGDQSGLSVSLSSDGSSVAIGAPLNDGGSGGSNSGQVRMYRSNRWNNVEWDGSLWVAVGIENTNTIISSPDGINWSVSAETDLFDIAGYDVSWNGSLWVAVGGGSTNTIATSPDGLTWTGRGKTIFDFAGYGITWNGSVWVAVGYGSTHTIATSPDGVSWTGRGKTIFDNYGFGYGVSWNGGIGTVKINNPRRSLAFGGQLNTIAYSDDDGTTWTGLGTIIFSSGKSAVYNGKIWVGCGFGTNTIAISPDGIDWTGLGNTIFTSSCSKVIWDGYKFIAVGTGTNTIATSLDGSTWTGLGYTIFDNSCDSIYWNGSLYVAVGGSSTSNTIAYSYDGTIWNGVGSAVLNYSYDVTFNGNLWIAVGEGGSYSIAKSTDGINWTGVNYTTFGTGSYGIAWNGLLFVAVGDDNNTVATSPDGIIWNGLGNTIFTGRGTSIYWNGVNWIAGGVGTNTVAISPDGITWTGLGVTIFSIGCGGGSSTYIYNNKIILDKYGAPETNKLDVVADSYFNRGFTNMSVVIQGSF